MAIIDKVGVCVALTGVLLLSGSAHALSPAGKCEASKLKTAGKYGFCRLKAEAKAVKIGDPPDYSKCDATYSLKWQSAETSAGGMCPTNSDEVPRQAELTSDANRTTWRLTGQPRFADNADGTISDHLTGLMWEKKTELNSTTNFPNPHDADNNYPWAGTCSGLPSKYCQPTAAAETLCAGNAEGVTGCAQCTGGEGTCSVSTTVWTWAADLNTASFAGHSDWRVPKLAELQSIVDYSDGTPPAVNTAFQGPSCGAVCTDITNAACSCTRSNNLYWSASTYAPSPGGAWTVVSYDGFLSTNNRSYNNVYIRAVRGGS